MRRWLYIMLTAIAASLLLPLTSSCERMGYVDEGEVMLQFSTDTLSFDTVFTTVGSTTRAVKVYNRSSHDVILSSITLAKGGESRFRLNVDGDTSMTARRVELLAGDSLFIFVQVNIRPNDQTSPFVEEDAILFSNGQRLPLLAWGRNAVYHKLQPTDTTWYSVIDCENWDHTRPHVILGTAAVLDGHTLQLVAGDEIYFGNDAMLIFDTNASIVATGTTEQPVIFSSLRHDGWYDYLPGQWQCLLFTGGSIGSVIDHAVVENGTGGLRAYPGAEFTIRNSTIRNMSDCALIGQGGSITGINLLVYDCLASLTVLRGGKYIFQHCTMADYWRYSSRKLESVILSNYLNTTEEVQADDLEAHFSECIIWGYYSDSEVLLLDDSTHRFDITFAHCHVKGNDAAEDPLFVDPDNDDYHLQDGSPAEGLGYLFENE